MELEIIMDILDNKFSFQKDICWLGGWIRCESLQLKMDCNGQIEKKRKQAGRGKMQNINERYRDFNDIMVKNSNFSERSD